MAHEKSITVTLEEVTVYLTDLPSLIFRATVRHRGTTLSFSEGFEPKSVLLEAMKEGVGSHQISEGVFDLTYIELNDKAQQAYQS